jgi:hypothetical protein
MVGTAEASRQSGDKSPHSKSGETNRVPHVTDGFAAPLGEVDVSRDLLV